MLMLLLLLLLLLTPFVLCLVRVVQEAVSLWNQRLLRILALLLLVLVLLLLLLLLLQSLTSSVLCLATALSEHGDAANADCGEERDYLSRPSRTLPFRSRLARPLPLGVVSHTAHRVHAHFLCFCGAGGGESVELSAESKKKKGRGGRSAYGKLLAADEDKVDGGQAV